MTVSLTIISRCPYQRIYWHSHFRITVIIEKAMAAHISFPLFLWMPLLAICRVWHLASVCRHESFQHMLINTFSLKSLGINISCSLLVGIKMILKWVLTRGKCHLQMKGNMMVFICHLVILLPKMYISTGFEWLLVKMKVKVSLIQLCLTLGQG